MTANDLTTLRQAAELLEANALSLCENHNINPQRPTWAGKPEARAAHDTALCTALRLRMLVKRIKAGHITVPPAPTFIG